MGHSLHQVRTEGERIIAVLRVQANTIRAEICYQNRVEVSNKKIARGLAQGLGRADAAVALVQSDTPLMRPST